MSRIDSVEALLNTLASGDRFDDGESIDLLAHGLQCASILARRAPDDVELQVAGLVHDLGTVLEPDRPATHAATGGAAVEWLLGRRVAALVTGHDQAKRYLVAADPKYQARLSATSVVTLEHQGGPMSGAEQQAFEAGEHFDALVMLRHADDGAKVVGRSVPSLDHWRPQLTVVGQDAS